MEDAPITDDRELPMCPLIGQAKRIASALFTLGVLTACGGDPTNSKHDSASVGGSVDARPVAFADAFALVDTIALEEPDSAVVARLSGIDVGPNGDIAIADASEANVKVYERDGRLLRVLGRKGGGPGEFSEPRYPRFRRDGSLLVAEGDGRVSVFASSGDFVRSYRLDRTVFISSFDVLPGGDLLTASVGKPGGTLFRYDSLGHAVQAYLPFATLPIDEQPTEPLWQTVAQYRAAARAETAFVFLTISDSVWRVDLRSGKTSASQIRFPGYARPTLPEMGAYRRSADRFAWIKRAHVVMSPVVSSNGLGVSFVQGILNYGDPTVFVFQKPDGTWISIADAPPIIHMSAGEILTIHRPNDDRTVLGRYRYLEGQ